MDTTFPRIYHASQLCLSAYSLYISSVTIPKLKKKEDMANKAAKWSNYIDRQLKSVIATQTSGALTPLISFLSAAYLAYFSAVDLSTRTTLLLCIINGASTASAHTHVSNFWKGKAHITFAKDFSESIDLTNRIRKLLAYQSVGWAGATVWYVARWMSS